MKRIVTTGGISLALLLGVFTATAVSAQSAWDADRVRSQIQSQINSALSRGQINAQHAENHRVQLMQNQAWQQSMSGDGLNPAEAQQVMGGLQGISNSLNSTIQSHAGGVYGAGVVAPMTGVVPMPVASNFGGTDLSGMLSTLSTQLENGRASRRLTASEYSSLRSELDRISQRINQSAFSGRFSDRRSSANRLNNFQVKLNRELNDRDVAGRFGNRWY